MLSSFIVWFYWIINYYPHRLLSSSPGSLGPRARLPLFSNGILSFFKLLFEMFYVTEELFNLVFAFVEDKIFCEVGVEQTQVFSHSRQDLELSAGL